MSKKSSNKILWYVFAGLLVIAVLILLKNSGGNERTFKNELVDIDSSAVTKILIYPKGGDKVKLVKENNDWKVNLNNGKITDVAKGRVDNMFAQVMELKANRLVAKDEDKWEDFGVDTSATRVEFYEGGHKALDLVIGRFSFQQPRTMNTYIRLTGETEVYEVDGYLGMTFSKQANDFRNKTIISGDMANWTNIDYEYPADSSFQLIKTDDGWTTSGGMPIDSARTVMELRRLSNITGTDFIDDINPDSLGKPEMILQISTFDGNSIKVDAYKYKDGYAIHSSLNPEAYFDGGKNKLWRKIFVGLKNFQKDENKK